MTNRMICITEEEYKLLCDVVYKAHDMVEVLSLTQAGLNPREEDLLDDTNEAMRKIENIDSRIKG